MKENNLNRCSCCPSRMLTVEKSSAVRRSHKHESKTNYFLTAGHAIEIIAIRLIRRDLYEPKLTQADVSINQLHREVFEWYGIKL